MTTVNPVVLGEARGKILDLWARNRSLSSQSTENNYKNFEDRNIHRCADNGGRAYVIAEGNKDYIRAIYAIFYIEILRKQNQCWAAANEEHVLINKRCVSLR